MKFVRPALAKDNTARLQRHYCDSCPSVWIWSQFASHWGEVTVANQTDIGKRCWIHFLCWLPSESVSQSFVCGQSPSEYTDSNGCRLYNSLISPLPLYHAGRTGGLRKTTSSDHCAHQLHKAALSVVLLWIFDGFSRVLSDSSRISSSRFVYL